MTKMEQVVELLKQTGTAVWETWNWTSADVGGKLWTPVGVMVHHTAMSSPLSVLAAQKNNRFNGPLCNFIVRNKPGVRQVDLVCDGYAYDSGMGNSQVLYEIRNDIFVGGNAKARNLTESDVSGNRWFIDIEVDHPGDGTPLNPEAYDALIDLIVSICRVYGWASNRVLGHKEWTARKIDPKWLDGKAEMPRIRKSVQEKLNKVYNVSPGQPDVSVPPEDSIFVLSQPSVTVSQMLDFSAPGTTRYRELAVVAWDESTRLGIDPAVTYAIMAHETGYGKFSNVVPVQYHNWGGIKTTIGGGNQDPAAHAKFPDDRTGVRAVAQHLGLYAGLFIPKDEVVDPRHFDSVRGRATYLPSDKWTWASDGPGWSKNIAKKVLRMRELGS